MAGRNTSAFDCISGMEEFLNKLGNQSAPTAKPQATKATKKADKKKADIEKAAVRKRPAAAMGGDGGGGGGGGGGDGVGDGDPLSSLASAND